MARRARKPFLAVLAGLFLFCSLPAHGEEDLFERVNRIFDALSRQLGAVGERAEDLVGRGPGAGELPHPDFAGLISMAREFSERNPVHPSSNVRIRNEFGEIRVDTWENPVVQVEASITVGAETADLAGQVLRSINIRVQSAPNAVDVDTVLPDTRDIGRVAIAVNYRLTVPRNANVVCENTLGDTYARGIGGSFALQSLFGSVELRDLSGKVDVWARGQFPLKATGLRQGGAFVLRGSDATFSNVSATLKVSNYMGAVTLRDIGADAAVDVTSESGPIALELRDAEPLDLEASALFGRVETELPVQRTSRGGLALARYANPDASRRFALHSTFADVTIRRDGSQEDPVRMALGEVERVQGAFADQRPVAEGAEIVIEALAVGDVHIVGVDEDTLSVTATPLVRMAGAPGPQAARAALEALTCRIEDLGGRLVVRTAAPADLETYGAVGHRVDLRIECPRTSPLSIRVRSGHAYVGSTGEALNIQVDEGSATIEHAKGPLDVTNQRGSVTVASCAGPARVSAHHGDVSVKGVYGSVTVSAEHGKTVVDSLEGPLTVRGREGDVRIMALEGIRGDYDVVVEKGSVSMVIPRDADAVVVTRARNGIVHSAIPMTGGIEQGRQEFQRHMRDGRYRVTLEARDGDVIID